MQTKFLLSKKDVKKKNFSDMKYDGTQLRGHFAYFDFKILGDSAVSWIGPCDVNFDHMVDGEDFLEGSAIRGSEMVHFIIEFFDQSLFSGVLLQRLFANIVRDVIYELSQLKNIKLDRSGDDLYFQKRKLSISIATKSPMSTLVHFAVNVRTEDVPVPAVGLKELKVNEVEFAKRCLSLLKSEYEDCQMATWKVRPVL